jgi:hypothetical protein
MPDIDCTEGRYVLASKRSDYSSSAKNQRRTAYPC